MSKTLAEIGLIVGGLAIALLAGPVGLGVFGSLGVMNQMIGIGITTALSGVGLALRQTPKQPVGAANSISFQSGPSPRRVIYGRFQTAGVLTYASFPPHENQATTNQYLHLVYTLCGHEITSFDAISIDGSIYNFGTDLFFAPGDGLWHVVPRNGGSMNDFYWQHMFFEFDFGRHLNVQPFPQLAAADAAWTGACIQLGCAKVHVVLRADSGWTNVFPGGKIPNIQFLVTGKKVVDPRVITNWLGGTGYVQYEYIVDNRGAIWVQANASGTSGATRPNFEAAGPGTTLADGTLSWTFHFSASTVVIAETGTGSNPQGNLVNDRLINDAWAASTAYVQYQIIEAPMGYYQQETVATGSSGTTEPVWSTTLGGVTPDGTQSWVCLGRSRHALNPSNPALVVNDYLQDTDYGMAAPASSIDAASVIAAANVCEDQVLIIWSLDGGQTYENLYACDGMFDHSSTRGNVLTALCGSMAGWVVPPGDAWHVFAGAYITPAVSIGDNDMRQGIKGDFRLSKRDVCNGVKGTFIPAFLPANPAGQIALTQVPPIWQPASFPAYQGNGLAGKPDYITEDGGQIIWQDVQLDFTTSLWMAQRLAKITMMRLRFQETITLPCKLTALNLEAGDTFFFTHLRWGINGGTFEVSQLSVVLDTKNKDAPALGIDIVGRQVDPSIYSFTPPQSAGDYGEYSPFGITGVMSGVE